MVITAAALAISALPASARTAYPDDASGNARSVGALPQIDATARPGARAIPLSPARRRELLDRAADAAPATARSLGLGIHETLIPKSVIEDADGTVHTRYERTYAGLPVLGGDLVVHRAGRVPDRHQGRPGAG